jgi:putative ABC transport system permease protein
MNGSTTRLWLRAARRRPTRALAAVVMAVVMTVATVSALVAGDSLARLFHADAAAEWGAVDVEARSARTAVFDDSVGRLLGVEAEPLAVRWAPRLILPAVASHDGRAEPTTQVLGLGAEDQSYPALQAIEGAREWLRLGPESVLVNQRLARRLTLSVGDELALVVAVPEWTERVISRDTSIKHVARTVRLSFSVAGIVANRDAADLHRTPNVIVSRDILQRRTDLLPARSTVLHLTAARHDRGAAKQLIDRVNATAVGVGMTLKPVRSDDLQTAAGEGGLFHSILLTLALLVVAAGAASVVNLLTAVGLERAHELAVLRALGLSRQQARRLLMTEAGCYGLVAAATGAALAIPLAGALAGRLSQHFAELSSDRGREQVELALTVRPWTVLLGVLLMVAVVTMTARAAAGRILARDLDSVLRGDLLRQPPVPSGLARPAIGLAVGAYCLGAASSSGAGGTLLYIGLTVLLAAWWLLARRNQQDRGRLDRRAAVAGLVWAFGGSALLGDFSQGVQAGFGVITVAGELAIVCVCVLLSARLRGVMRRVRSYAPGGLPQVALLAAGANAEESRDRSGLAMGTVAAALFAVAALTVLGNASGLSASRQGGGFDVLATSVADAGVESLRSLPEAAAVVGVPSTVQPERRYRVEDESERRMTVPYPVRVASVDAELVAAQRFGVADALPGYGNAAQALQAVLNDDDKAVLDRYARPEGAQPGDDVVLDTPSGVRRFRLIAVLDTFLLNTVFLSDTSFGAVTTRRGDTMVLARSAPGVSRPALKDALLGAGRDVGLAPKTVDEARRDVIAVNRTFTDLFAVLLLLSLLVAITSLAAGVMRTARERRRELGVLRALGAERRHVALLLAAEPVLAATLGATVGLGVGLLLLRVLFAVGFSELPFLIDWGRLGIVVLAVEALMCVTCWLAAWPASRRDVEADLADLG